MAITNRPGPAAANARRGGSRRHRPRSPRLTFTTVGVLSLLLALVWAPPVAHASAIISVTTLDQEVNGDADCSLQEAIYSANLDDNVAPDASNPGQLFDTGCVAGSGADRINLLPPFGVFTFADPITDPDNFVGPAATPIITSTILIEGSGARLQRHPLGRDTRAFVVGPAGHLTLREVHLAGFTIHGGKGADGGGGGLGAGGAVYVQAGSLTIDRTTFEGNSAYGGNGSFQDVLQGGGGGGLSGDGGAGSGESNSGGGGGGGSRGDGAIGHSAGDYYQGGGGGGRVTSGSGAQPGLPCGGAGGSSLSFPSDGAEDGGSASCAGGGGGGGTDREFLTDPYCGGDGGAGAYGGGGGGGGDAGDGGHGGFGGGGGGAGGDGGFGGGGGSDNGCPLTTGSDAGQGGTFAGDGGGAGGGGGGALGGAVFGYNATIDVVNSTFTGNGVARGRSGGGGANDGRGAGGAIFTVAGSLTVASSTISGNETGEWTLVNGQPVGIGGGGLVVYEPTTGESASLTLSNTIVAGNGPIHECYVRNGVSVSGDGNLVVAGSAPSVANQTHAACPGIDVTLDPLLESLALNKPGRTPTMKLAATSPAINAAVGTSPQTDQRLLLRPQGGANDIGAYEAATIPPVTMITLDPAAPDGTNDWYRGTVGVTVLASDVDGTVAQTRCALDPAAVPAAFADLPDAACALSNVGTDGQHAIYAASIDAEGNAEPTVASASFKRDGTPPTLSPSLNVTTVGVGQTGVVASPHAGDALSGLASSSCGSIDTVTPGVHTVTCNASDNAGNTASASLIYVVEYRILGFFSPTPGSKWRVGQTVPIKVALGDHLATRIADSEASGLAAACRVTFTATGAQTKAAPCLKFDAVNDQFVYNWKLAKAPTGPATITVSVSYPGTSVVTHLTEQITITR